MRRSMTKTKKTAMTKPKPLPKLDADGILKVLGQVREMIPQLNKGEAIPPPRRGGSDVAIPLHVTEDAMEEFEYQTVIEGLETLVEDIDEALEQSHAKLVEDCLRVYYKMQELSLDGEHDDLIPKVVDLREVYERTYGEPIPTPEEADRRAKKRAKELAKKRAERGG